MKPTMKPPFTMKTGERGGARGTRCGERSDPAPRRALTRARPRPNESRGSSCSYTLHNETVPVRGPAKPYLKTTFFNQKGQPSRNITADEYEDVLKRMLLPEGRRLFASAGLIGWVLQQDNDPAHKRRGPQVIKAWNSARRGRVELLRDWPPNSPDLSPIENAWALVQAKVDAAGCKTFSEFQSTLLKTWQEMPQDVIKSLMASMPRRLSECVAKGGNKTRF